MKRILLNLLLVLGITFTGSPVAKAQTFQNLAQINGLTQSELIINSTPKAGGSLKLSWKFTDQSRGGIRALEEKNVYDRYSGRNYNLKEIETAWVVRVVNLSCFSSNNSPVGKTLSILRVNFLEPFTPVKNLHISPNWIVNESQTDINFGVNEKCAEIRVNSSIELNLQAIASFNSSELSRLVWLDTQTQANLPLISIKGVPAPIKAPTNTPINTPTKKSNPKAKPSSSSKAPSKKASCYIFQGEKIDATYGMAEPPFGVTTIKFENITDCRLDLSIRGDFIGSESGNQKMLCSVNGSWSLDPYSRVEFAPYTNASGSISFKTVFPQLSKCFRTVNAQRNFIAVITGSNEG